MNGCDDEKGLRFDLALYDLNNGVGCESVQKSIVKETNTLVTDIIYYFLRSYTSSVFE